jgi:methylmalonyl-CoA mutase C-terminal domain/subunit
MSDMQEERKFMRKKYRILLAKPGLDGHDRGIKVVAAALRDAGFEVIYTGLRQTAEMIVEAAIQEDVDAIGMSILSGAHMTLFPAVMDLLKKRKCEHIILFGGGIIPDEDISKLEKKGVGKLFTPGATTGEIIAYLNKTLKEGRKEEAVF